MRPEVPIVSQFADRLIAAMKARGFSSRRLSAAIGKSSMFLTPYIKKTAKRLPDAATLLDIAEVLEVTTDYLLKPGIGISIAPPDGISETSSKHAYRVLNEVMSVVSDRMNGSTRPTIDDFLNWSYQTGGRIDQSNPMAQYFDIHEAPSATDRILRPKFVGVYSLSSERIGTPSPKLLRTMMENMPPEQMEKIVLSHKQMEGKPEDLSKQWIEVDLPEHGISFKTHYWRVIRPMYDAQGTKCNVTFCTPAAPSK